MDLIYTDVNYNEIGYLSNLCNIDMELGSVLTTDSSNDFQLEFPIDDLPTEIEKGSLIYEVGSEYGGVVTGLGADTANNKAYVYGTTWRGMLYRQIIEPTSGQAYYYASGEANEVLRGLIDDRFEGLIIGSTEISSFTVSRNFRYINLLEGIEKMLSLVDAKIKIVTSYDDDNNIKAIVSATAINNYSNDIQFDNDYGMTLVAKKAATGVNHVICLGQGELTERTVIHLYKLEDGTITQDSTSAITGIDENTIVYDYSSCETEEELIEGGESQFDENADEESLEITVDEDVEIGDIISAKEQITGITMQKSVSQKILKGYINNIDVSYKVGE